MRRLLLSALVLASFGGFGGFAGAALAQPYPPPPPPRYEAVPPPTTPGYAWRPGRWDWNGRRYVWFRGAYIVRPVYGTVFVAGHWADRPRGWVWVPAHWR